MSKPTSDESYFLLIWFVSSYMLYWPMFWLHRAGMESHHANIDFGPAEFWVVMWILAPIVTWMHAFGAFISWIAVPVIKFLAQVLV